MVAKEAKITEEIPVVEDTTCPEVIQVIEEVGDWETRFRLAKYTERQKRFIAAAHTKQREFEQILNESNWINQVTDPKNDVTIDYIISPRGNNCFRAYGYMPYPVDYV